MLHDHPLLTLLGRRGRGAVIETLLRNPKRTWSVRDLARSADVPPMLASRTVRELQGLAVVEVERPGRDARVRLLLTSVATRWLASLDVPDLRSASATTFRRAVRLPRSTRLLMHQLPGDILADPATPVRLAILLPDGADPGFETTTDAVGRGLDAVRTDGLPPPAVTLWRRSDIDAADPVGAAILAGRLL